MRITVCETPHGPAACERAWARLCAHSRDDGTDLLVLPEFAFLEPVWERERFDSARWTALEQEAERWLARLPELDCAYVIGSAPVTAAGNPMNRGFLWTPGRGVEPLRSKRYLPNEPGNWEGRWFTRSADDYAVFSAGPMRFGLNICTELWALETLASYADAGANAVVTPRATGAATTERWIALAKTVAVRTASPPTGGTTTAPAAVWAGSSIPRATSWRVRPPPAPS